MLLTSFHILYTYFNPRSREGSDMQSEIRPSHLSISIHAPARGATRWRSGRLRKNYNFNPRSREGSDKRFDRNLWTWEISIHAPARGATTGDTTGFLYTSISIHAPARGATKANGTWHSTPKFQSTLPRGERLYMYNIPIDMIHFNPRSREGSDSDIKSIKN